MAEKRKRPALPAWAEYISDRKIAADPDKFYPAMFDELKADEDSGFNGEDDIDQYWLEVAYQMMKMDLQVAAGGFGKQVLEIKVLNRPAWALKKFRAGKGVAAATGGKEARVHYERLRGRLPS